MASTGKNAAEKILATDMEELFELRLTTTGSGLAFESVQKEKFKEIQFGRYDYFLYCF